MSRYLLSVSMLVAVVLNCVSPLSADCRRGLFRANQVRHVQANQHQQQQHEVKLAVPFAVPVAVPVAPFAPYFYGSGALYGYGAAAHSSAASTSAFIAAQPAAESTSALARHCLACHGTVEPRGQLSLASPQLLSPENRLAAIRAVLAGRMPQGSKLSPEELRAVLGELCEP